MAADKGRKDDPFGHIEAPHRERVRFRATESRLSGNRSQGLTTADEEIIKQNGYRSTREFREVEFSMAMTVSTFVSFLVHYQLKPWKQDLQSLRMAITANLRRARSEGLPWIFLDAMPAPERVSDAVNQLDEDDVAVSDFYKMKNWWVYPRPATLYLMSMPTERDLVADEIREFIETTTAAEQTRNRSTEVEPIQLTAAIETLRELYPNGAPKLTRKVIKQDVDRKLGRRISLRTLDRARKVAWQSE